MGFGFHRFWHRSDAVDRRAVGGRCLLDIVRHCHVFKRHLADGQPDARPLCAAAGLPDRARAGSGRKRPAARDEGNVGGDHDCQPVRYFLPVAEPAGHGPAKLSRADAATVLVDKLLLARLRRVAGLEGVSKVYDTTGRELYMGQDDHEHD